MDKKKLFFIVLALLVSIGFIWNQFLSNRLHTAGIKTKGRIINYRHLRQADYILEYSYRVGDSLYKGSVGTNLFKCQKKNGVDCLTDSLFDVIYSKSKPYVSDINLGIYNNNKGRRLYY